jgi:hypothetical protein
LKNQNRRKAFRNAHLNNEEGRLLFNRQTTKLLHKLKRHKFIEPFLQPVNPVALNIPSYFSIIKQPMDISTVDRNLSNKHYTTLQEFVDDIQLIWNNAMTFNPLGTHIYNMAYELKHYFDQILMEERSGTKTKKKDERNLALEAKLNGT